LPNGAGAAAAGGALGIFGVRTLAVGGELFWGDDRLEDAIPWHRGAPVTATV
jgi:2-hydroxychromene-2-carboxylate isomerase